jgi:hypothetical protein
VPPLPTKYNRLPSCPPPVHPCPVLLVSTCTVQCTGTDRNTDTFNLRT